MNPSFTRLNPTPDPIHGVPCSRSSHGVSVVNNGTCLILYGGEHVARTPLDNKQALWLATKKETKLSDKGEDQWKWKCVVQGAVQPPPRVAHAQAAVVGESGNDEVYIFGGRVGINMQEQALNDLWKLNVASLEWTKVETTGTPPCPRSFHRMIAVSDRILYVFGGCGENGRLADLYKLDLKTLMWHSLGSSTQLRGRGGANLLHLQPSNKLAVVAGFAGEETNDGHAFHLETQQWEEQSLKEQLNGLRPRSVCVAASSSIACIIFGGEVDPSERGHEGAGGFTNDVVLLEPSTGKYLGSKTFSCENAVEKSLWPQARGWSDGSLVMEKEASNGKTRAQMYIFGGLSGDDTNPIRLDDLWRLDISPI